MARRLYSRPELKTERGIPFSDATLYRMIKAKTFPAPIKIGIRTNAWIDQELDKWEADRVVERGEAA